MLVDPHSGTTGVAILYPRVSSPKQIGNWSMQWQHQLTVVGEQRGLQVVIYGADEGLSGETIEDRKAMPMVLEDLAAGETRFERDHQGRPLLSRQLRAILIADLDRFTRDEDGIDGFIIMKACRIAGVLAVTPNKVYDFETDADQLVGALEMVLSGKRKQKIIKASITAIYTKAHAGEWPIGAPPYGYHFVADAIGKPRMAIEPDEAQAVRLAYELYVNGLEEEGRWRPLTLAGVATELNRRGYRFRTRRYRRGPRADRPETRPFAIEDVQRLLKNRLYTGCNTWGQGRAAVGRTNRYARTLGPADVHRPDWQIVDADLWFRAQEQRGGRARGPRRLAAVERAFLGLLRCPHCGGHMSARTERYHTAGGEARTRVLYLCLRFRRHGYGTEAGCPEGGHIIAETVVRGAVHRFLVDLFEGIDLEGALDEEAAGRRADVRNEQTRALRDALDETRLARGRLVDAVVAGALSHADVRAKREELEAKEARLTRRLERLTAAAADEDGYAAEIENLRGRVAEKLWDCACHQPARFRQFLGFFFTTLVVEAEGPKVKRVGRVTGHRYSERGARFLQQNRGDGGAGVGATYESSSLDDISIVSLVAELAPALSLLG
jgi:hypothetical protein